MAFNAHINISGSSDGAKKASDDLGKSFKSASDNASDFVKNLNKMAQVNNQVRANVNSANNALIDFRDALIGLGTAKAAFEIYKVRNQFIGWENQLYAVSGSLEEASSQLEDLIGVVKVLGTDLSTSVAGFVQLNAAAKGSTVSTEQLLGVFESFSGMLTLFNADTLKVEGTFRALTQMFSKGVVQAEELRGQLAEHLPGALQIAARAMGKTTWALSDMMKKGLLLPEDLIPKMGEQIQKEFGAAIERAMNTPRGAYNRLITEAKIFMNELGKVLEGDFIKVINAMASSLNALTTIFKENSDLILLAIRMLAGYAAAWLAVGTAVGIYKTAAAAAKLETYLLSAAMLTIPGARVVAILVSAIGLLAGAIYHARDAIVEFNGVSASVSTWASAAWVTARKYFDDVVDGYNRIEKARKDFLQATPAEITLVKEGSFFEKFKQAQQELEDMRSVILDSMSSQESGFSGMIVKLYNGIKSAMDDLSDSKPTGIDFNEDGTFSANMQKALASLRTFRNEYLSFSNNISQNAATIQAFETLSTSVKTFIESLNNSGDADALAAVTKAYDDLIGDVTTSTDESISKTEEYKFEIEALKKGVESAARAMVTYRAEMEAIARVRILNSTIGPDTPNGAEEFSAGLAAIRESMRLQIEEGNTRLDLEAARTKAKESLKDEKKALKEANEANIDLIDSIRALKDAYMSLVSGMNSLDRELRDQGLLYGELTDNVVEYTHKLNDIPNEVKLPKLISDASNELNANDPAAIARYRSGNDPIMQTPTTELSDTNAGLQKIKDLLGEIKALNGIDTQRQYLASFGTEIRNGIEVYTAFNDIAIKVSMSNEDLKFTLDSMYEEFGPNAQSATADMDAFSTSVENGRTQITQATADAMKFGGSFSYYSTALEAGASLLKRQQAVIKSEEEIRAALRESMKVVVQYKQLYADQGFLTGPQLEGFNFAIDESRKQLDLLAQAKEDHIALDRELIHNGELSIWTYTMSKEEIQGLSASYDTGASRAREYAEELADINRLLAENEISEYEASVARTEAAMRKLSPIGRDIGDAFSDAFKSVIEGTEKLEDVVKSLLKNIADAIYKELVQKQIVNFIGGLFTSGVTKSADGNIMTSSGAVDLKRFASGGIMTHDSSLSMFKAANDSVNFKAYSTGGIANKPQLAMFGEGSTPEAYVPLPDGRSIPVTMKAEGTNNVKAQSAPAPEVKVVVNNMPGQNAEVSRDNQGNLTIDIVRATLASDVNKGGTPWVGAIERKYGMSRGRA